MIVDHVSTLADAEAVAELWPYDVVVLDRRVPDGEGLDLIPKLRGLGVGAPVLMLTALGSINDRVAGLDAGADDYLSKPFAVEELMARLRALARRPVSLKAEQTKVGRLIYDFHHREAAVDDKPLDLLRRERLALEALMRRPGRTVLRATLEESVYAMEDEISTRICRACAGSSMMSEPASRSGPSATSAISCAQRHDESSAPLAAMGARAPPHSATGGNAVCLYRPAFRGIVHRPAAPPRRQ